MLFDVAAWVVILLVAWTVGRGALALLRVDDLRPGDALLCSMWIGVVTLGLALLGTSIIVPLSPVNASVVAILLVALGTVAARRARSAAALAPASERSRGVAAVVAGTLAIGVGAAALTSDPVTLYDSLVYHVGIMRWLREHGTVPGLALVHNRLGHVSAWFTLAAPFDHSVGVDRMATIPLGVALVLVGMQTAIALGRIVARRAWVADWFFVAVVGGLLWAVVAGDAATPSPDVSTNVLIAVSAWAVLVVSQRTSGEHETILRAGHAAIPLVLAVGAATMKLFALPAVLVVSAFFTIATRVPGSTRSMVRGSVIAGAVVLAGLAPFLAANVAASGCPLFPSPMGCVSVPWSVGGPSAADYAEYIRDVARWDRRGNIPPNDATGWIVPWIGAHPVATLLALLSPLVGVVLLRHARRDRHRRIAQPLILGTYTVVALGVTGIAFAAWQAPAPRFLFTVALLIPALAAAYWLHAWAGTASAGISVARVPHRFSAGFASAALLVGFTYGIASQKLNVWSALVHGAPAFRVDAADLLLPEAPQSQTRLFRWRVNDMDVLTPVPMPIADTLGYHSVIAHNAEFEKCSTAPLPCTPYLPGRDIRLRRPNRGLAGGFIRVDEPDFVGGAAVTCLGELSAISDARAATLAEPRPALDASRCSSPASR